MPKSQSFTRVAEKGREHRVKTNRPQPTDDTRAAGPLVPVVGIGASAGGLEALDLFLRNVPADRRHHCFQDAGGGTTQDANGFAQTNQRASPET